MKLGAKILVFLCFLLFISQYCRGITCFEGHCIPPSCIKLTITGQLDCMTEEPTPYNGTWMLTNDSSDESFWYGVCDEDIFIVFDMCYPDSTYCNGWRGLLCVGDQYIPMCGCTTSSSNAFLIPYNDCSRDQFTHLGTVSWEPVWDCHECETGNGWCEECDQDPNTEVTVKPSTTIYAGNLACCPPGGSEYGYIELSSDTGEVVQPVKPVITGNAALVEVTPKSTECFGGRSIMYMIKTIPADAATAKKGKSATVTCSAKFKTRYGGEASATGSIKVEIKCAECCQEGSGCPAAGL